MENKLFTFRSDELQFKTEGKLKSEKKYYIEGYASTTDKDLAGEVINLGNPEEYKIIDFAQIIKKLVDSKSSIIFKALPQDDPKQRKPDIKKAKKILKWKPNLELKEGLKKTIIWFKDKIGLN